MINDKNFKIINGNSLEVLDTLEENSIDAIVTDPPYGLTSITKRFGKEGSAPNKYGTDGSFARLTKGFMGKEWDGSGIEYNIELWKKALRVLKPGGYLLAFGGTRTYHRIACAIEDAGFEIRDCIMWLYGSGFPKSHDVGLYIDKKLGCPDRGHRIAVANRNHPDGTLEPNGENLPRYEGRTELGRAWAGWGTALKPAYEPIIMARKALYKTVADNVMTYGCGGINIDECRVGDETVSIHNAPAGSFAGGERNRGSDTNSYRDSTGRFPANVIHDGSEEVVAGMPDTKCSKRSERNNKETVHTNTYTPAMAMYNENNTYGDEGSASRYFYCAKASSKDRDEGLENFEKKQMYSKESGNQFGYGNANGDNFGDRIANVVRTNIHPTVKPCALMQYLVRLVTPKGGTVLDIFNGSGSTGKAVAYENRERNADYKYIGIELDPEYCKISEARIDYALHKYEYETKQAEADKTVEDNKQEPEQEQLNLFDFVEEGSKEN